VAGAGRTAGYSGTPLVKKLGLAPPLRLFLAGAPPEYDSWLDGLPAGVSLVRRAPRTVEAAHVFATRRAALAKRLASLRRSLAPAGFLWVSWPKKSSNVPTEVTEDVIRELALPLGLVDVKVCAVTEVWSGLKLVIRRSERPASLRRAPGAGAK